MFGGLHLVTTPVEEIDSVVENLKTKWKVQRIAPGHCTGEPAFEEGVWGELFVCGVGDEGGTSCTGDVAGLRIVAAPG